MPATAAYMREYYKRMRNEPRPDLVGQITEFWRGHNIEIRVEKYRYGKWEVECIRSDIGERMRL